MAVRIQLASNFQVVELTYDNWSEVNYEEVSLATDMVNRLGSEVVNEIKTKDKKKEEKTNDDEPMASEKQIKFACKLGLNETKAKKMTQKELWQWIQNNK